MASLKTLNELPNVSIKMQDWCMVTIDFKLVDVKLESTEAYLLKLGKNPS